jgi:hypothetical protein
MPTEEFAPSLPSPSEAARRAAELELPRSLLHH